MASFFILIVALSEHLQARLLAFSNFIYIYFYPSFIFWFHAID